VTLTQYVRAILRRAWLLGVLPVLAVAGALAVTQTFPPTYESEAHILVRSVQPISPLDTSSQNSSSDEVARTYAQLLAERPLLAQVISDLKLQTTPGQLQSAIKITPQPNTTVLKITVQSSDPVLARDIANKLIQDFVAQTRQIQQRQVNQYRSSVEAQLNKLRSQIQTEQARIDQLNDKANQSQPSPSGSAGSRRASTPSAGLRPEDQTELANLQEQVALDRSQYAAIVHTESDIQVNVARAADNLVILSPAETPTTPISPKPMLNALLAALGGLALGVGLTLLLEHFDSSIRTDEQLIEHTGLRPLGHIPFSRGNRGQKELVVLRKEPFLAEPYKALRTNLLFSAMDREPKVITVTSATPKEGKSRIAANLAIALAKSGRQTLLIDCDLRRAVQHRLFNRSRNIGLADLIVGEVSESEVILPVDNVPNLYLLSSGSTPHNASEMLDSIAMRTLLGRVGEAFDNVVLDTPAVNVVTDGLIVGRHTEATLLVVEHGRSRYPAVRKAREALDNVGARVVGCALNKVPSRDRQTYYRSSPNGKRAESPIRTEAPQLDGAQLLVATGRSQEPPN
jgi:capsular exopolysaccharide synthesis family protein